MAGKFELNTAANGKFFFNLKASNGQIILSSETYESKASAQNGIESVKKNAVDDARYDRRTATASRSDAAKHTNRQPRWKTASTQLKPTLRTLR